jgi:LytS/YehU family sensor histidine kinase
VSKSEHTADAIMKLSNIMRYVTDEVNEDFVSLQNEIDAINDYISLQKMRLSKKVNVQFEVSGNIVGKVITPLLLMPFVENVFKHGISTSEQSDVLIKLTIAEKNITLLTQNKLFDTPRIVERTGIGNTNTKQRLQQIYPDKHLLDISAENGLFTVQLVLST